MAEELNDREEPLAPGSDPGEEPAKEGKATFARRPVIKKRRSRKERHEDLAQPDEFVEVGGTFIDWLMERGKFVAIVSVLILLTLAGSAIHRKMSFTEQAEAASHLFKAKKLLPSSSGTQSSLGGGLSFNLGDTGDEDDKRSKTEAAVKGLEAVSKDYRGTPQSRQAQVLAGRALYNIGEYERALVFLDDAATSQDLMGDRAKDLRGFTLLALDRAPEAVTVFSMLRDTTSGGTRAYATMHLAAAHEATGDMEKARGVYELFETEFPDSDLLPEVQARAGATNAAP